MPDLVTPILASATIKDFQSLANLHIEFDNMTVIVGKNSVGKSAFIRSLEAAFYNRAGGTFIREGATSTEVELVFAPRGGSRPPSVTWRKPAKGGATLEMDNGVQIETISRMGKQPPPALLDLTGVREYSIGIVKIRPQFMDQGAAAFLLSESGTKAASVLARVSGLDVVVVAQGIAKRKRTKVEQAATAAAERETLLTEQLNAQPDYEAMLGRWTAASTHIAEIRVEQSAIQAIWHHIAERRRLLALRAAWEAANLRTGIDTAQEALNALRLGTAAVEVYRQRRASRAAQADVLAKSKAVVEVVTPEVLEKVQGLETTARDAAHLVAEYRVAVRDNGAAGDRVEVATQEVTSVETALHEALDGLEICPVCLRVM